MRHYLRRCVIGAAALMLVGLPVTAIATPATSRAYGECAPGWGWSAELNECLFLLPAANGPGGPGGPWRTGGTRWTGTPRATLESRLAAATRRSVWRDSRAVGAWELHAPTVRYTG